MNKIIKKSGAVLGGVCGAFALSVAAYIPFVAADASKNFEDECEYLMILGGDVFGADTPSPQLKKRMERAADYLLKYENVIAVPCGGCFRKEQKKSEAQIIADYLIDKGVDADKIILEDKSTTTFENFKFAKEIIENHSGKSINDSSLSFLSSTYHIHRAEIISRMNGIENVGKVSAPTPGKAAQRFIREYFVVYELLLRKLGIKK